eukprot:gene8929-6411_t
MFREQLTTYEMDYILDSSLGEAQQYQRFFIFWALKEAFIKAIGQGLGYDLKKVEFHVQYRRRHPRGDEHEDSEPGELKAYTCWWTGEAEVWINASDCSGFGSLARSVTFVSRCSMVSNGSHV